MGLKTGRAWRRRTGGLAVGILALALFVPTAPARAADDAKPLDATELAARTYPGVQLIAVDFEAELTVPVAKIDDKALERLQNRIARQIVTGTVDSTDAAIVNAFVNAIADDPLTYFKPSSQSRSTTAKLSGFGTGWVVTPDGYIVTAAHVVSPDEDELKEQFVLTALDEWNEQDVEEFVNAASDNGDIFNKKQIKKLLEASTEFNAHHLKLGTISKEVSAQIGVAVTGFGKSRKGSPVEIVAEGEGYPGKDVALLKLDGQTVLPTLPVGQDSQVQEGDTLHVAGYPAASTFLSGLSEDSEVQPTVTQGPLTAIKSNESGTPVFQTQAPASPGNSGGPVLDDSGDVVGILVAAALDDKGAALENQEFVVPISVVSQMLRENNVTPQTGPVTETYNEALADYYRKYYKRALPQFERVRNLYGSHPYVGKFISDSQAAIDAGKDETPLSAVTLLLLGVGVLAVLAVIVLVVLLLVITRRRSRRAKVGPQFAMAGTPPPGYPTQPHPQQGYPTQPPAPQGYPPQGYPQQPQGYPQQPPYQPPGHPTQPHPQQDYPPQPPQESPQQPPRDQPPAPD